MPCFCVQATWFCEESTLTQCDQILWLALFRTQAEKKNIFQVLSPCTKSICSSSSFPGISRKSWPKMDQKHVFSEILKHFIWAQLCAYGNSPCTKSLLNFLWIHSSSGFPGISRKSWPKIAQKGAFFKIFKPIILAQLCAYGNCPCTKSLQIFFRTAAQLVFRE